MHGSMLIVQLENEEAIVVGVNRFQTEQASAIPTLRVDQQVEQDQRRHH